MNTDGGVTWFAAKEAVTERSAVTFKSVRLAELPPSDQETKWKPADGIAVTVEPFAPEFTVCGVDPLMLPPAPAA